MRIIFFIKVIHLWALASVIQAKLLLRGADEDPQDLWLPPPPEDILFKNRNDDPIKFLDGVSSVTTFFRNNGIKTTTTICFGYKDIPNKIPMAPDSHFPIGSNSKLYTAVAIYQLQEKGLLNVDDDIATMLDYQDFVNFGLLHDDQGESNILFRRKKTLFCPKIEGSRWWSKCEKITLRNMLSMSSGIYPSLNCDAPQNDRGHNECNRDPFFVNRGSIGKTVGTFLLNPLMFRPGTEYHYSNPNFVLATYFVEKYSGLTFREYLDKYIFSRIGLKNTYFDFYNQGMRLDLKRVGQYFKYFDKDSDELISVGADILQLDLGVASGTGGIVSTVQDQASFWYALFNLTSSGAPLLSSPTSQIDIMTPWTLMGKQGVTYPNGETATLWIYYGQGIGLACDADECRNGIRWILYTGGTISVNTANLLDFETMKMVQVWTSSIISRTDRKSFQQVFDRQSGSALQVVEEWADPFLNNPMTLAWLKMFEPTKNSSSVQLPEISRTEQPFDQVARTIVQLE
ncbi:hypothetical protein ACA910_013541 [Epithemia clementina (nom. ined.)]